MTRNDHINEIDATAERLGRIANAYSALRFRAYEPEASDALVALTNHLGKQTLANLEPLLTVIEAMQSVADHLTSEEREQHASRSHHAVKSH